MGGKDSKLACISYEEAMKRVSEAEFKRLKEAFKRASTLNGMMTETQFVREVLWDGVPAKLAQLIYQAFGGNQKGLTYKDLLCGMVVLTQGTLEEKIKFIFGMYADDTYSYVQKEEMDRRVLETEGQVSHALSDLFRESDQVDYEHFKAWVLRHCEATIVSKWLLAEPSTLSLSNDTEAPTFYQTLAGVTHLEETDINELEKRYWVLKAQSRSGRFDFETFKPLICPPIPEVLAEGLFSAFDENMDNHIDFKEMACGISACCRGPVTERQKFCFKVFDSNHDGKLNHDELKAMLESLMLVRKENKPPRELDSDIFHKLDAETVTKEILSCHDSDGDGCITMEEYLVWTVNNTLSEDFLNILSQICHIVLGLRPQTKEEEGKVVKGWLERESRKPLLVGQTWYLVAIQWWNAWKDYINHDTYAVANGHVTLGEEASKVLHPSPSRAKIAKVRGAQPIPSEDDNFVVVTKVTPTGESRLAGTLVNLDRNSSNGSLTSSPMKTSLQTGTPDNLTCYPAHSPSPSPKMKKKTLTPTLPQRPGAVDNTPLIVQNSQKQPTLTNEGGKLKRDTTLARGRDFELIPEPVWRALSGWYGGSPALPRNVIAPGTGDPELELYPINVRLLRHQTPVQRPPPTTTFTGMMAGIGGMTFNSPNFVSSSTPRRYLAYTAAFSRRHTLQQIYDFLCTRLRFCREDIRLWKFKDEHNMTLLDDEGLTVEDVTIEENSQLLIEVRNKDLTWPEEMSQLAKNKNLNKKDQTPTDKGATGLSNLGNTCFMNAAVQCVSNTWPLTQYFTGGLHLYELNRTNPLGMKGHIAQRYGDLVKDIWSGTTKTLAPLKLRWTIGKYAPRFNGFQQHDSQELLSFLLDGLHEDLNRVHDKPYVELKDSDGRPDEEVAREAWENHLLRNQSIIVDLFHGQLKSQVCCKECGTESVRFDPFNYLSLPLPMDSCIHLEITVIRSDGTVPVRYGMRLTMDEKYKVLKKELSNLSSIPTNQLLLVEVIGPIVKTLPQDNQKIRTLLGGTLYSYELPPPPEIDPMTAEEEKKGNQTESIGLNEIQRGKQGRKPCTNPVSPEMVNGTVDGQINGHAPQLEPTQTMGTLLPTLSNGPTSCLSSPSHSRNSSSASTNGLSDSLPRTVGDVFNGFIIGVHRKMIHLDVYFLSSQKSRPSLFGTPIILPCHEKTTNQDLYQFVWTQVARLVSPLPPSEAKTTNHAQDCDDSLGYEYPFTLKVVQKDGYTCAWCPWYKFCRGCKVECNNGQFEFGSSFLAIDWEPTALHLRYQTSHERFFKEHESVEESRRLQSEPIDLDNCLQAFTKEEELAEDEQYYCSKCKKHCLAAKKLDIWRLPSILIVNLKRFQFLNGRWVKSHKIVKFPVTDFDPTKYLAPRCPDEDDLANGFVESHDLRNGISSSSMQSKEHSDTSVKQCNSSNSQDIPQAGVKLKNGTEEESGSVVGNHVSSQAISAARSVRTCSESGDYSGVRYNLYALSCHTGILGGGHYVAYAKNPNDKWYCYNDSSCKEVDVDQMDTNSAYILFYERCDMNYSKFYPDIRDKEPDMQEIDDEFETEFRKMCIIQ